MLSRSAALLILGLLAAPIVVRGQTPSSPATGPVVVTTNPALVATAVVSGSPHNARIVRNIEAMPRLQGYATTHLASVNLARAVGADPAGMLSVAPAGACPSYCSGATYLVFLKTVADLRLSNLRGPALEALLPAGRRDGEAVWGRWNANGPGTARLFSELNLGTNFTRFEDAQPGDFMKVWWTQAIGKSEHGHSVIYLGPGGIAPDGTELVRFWSSNQKGDLGPGYGAKTIPRTKVSRVVFSRLEHPENLARAATLPPLDDYLASLLKRDTTPAEMTDRCHVRERP